MRKWLFLLGCLPSLCLSTVKYSLNPDLSHGQFDVSIRIEHPGPSESFQIPGWSPGFYVMEKYETKISEFEAKDEVGTLLSFSHPDSRTWKVNTSPSHEVIVSYKVKGDDVGLGFFAASVQKNEAYTNGPATFMYVLGRRTENTELTPTVPKGWNLATSMDPSPTGFSAGSYDEMADEPIQMGNFQTRDFQVEGIPFKAVFQPMPGEKIRWNTDQETKVLERVSSPAVKMFGGAPFKRYTYFFHLTGLGFQGGLEHRNGTVIAVPNQENLDISDLAAHEFFHAWNVKQIRPSVLEPFDYTQPQRTGNLWFAEGVTDYYSKILTYRSGVHDLGWLLLELSDQVNTFQQGKTRLTHTVEEASRAVWENGGFNLGDLDYYNKGLLSGLILDAKIREVSLGTKSLDDVMRLMYSKYRLPQAGYPEDGIKQSINEVVGTDLSDLYDLLIRSTADLPYEELKSIGLQVSAPNQETQVAVGGYPVPISGNDKEMKEKGIDSSETFLGFETPKNGASRAVFAKTDGAKVSVNIGTRAMKFLGFTLNLNPSPTDLQSKLFFGWAAR